MNFELCGWWAGWGVGGVTVAMFKRDCECAHEDANAVVDGSVQSFCVHLADNQSEASSPFFGIGPSTRRTM